MAEFWCNLWPYLAGGLIGWLLAGWLARRLRKAEPPVERIIEKEVEIEKVVDNPEHLSLISRLENENKEISTLKSQIAGFESASPEIREVEKIVEVDNPELLAKLKRLEEENREIPSLRSRITELESSEGRSFSNSSSKPMGVMGSNETASTGNPEVIDSDAAKAAGFTLKMKGDGHDFTVIEGVGPKINDLIHGADIHTYSALAQTSVSAIQKILDDAGSRYSLARPDTWPKQASMAAANQWEALKVLQDELDGGV